MCLKVDFGLVKNVLHFSYFETFQLSLIILFTNAVKLILKYFFYGA